MAAGMGFAQTRRRALSRAEQGKALSLDEVEALLLARDADLERAMSSARHLRDLGWGNTVTYSRKVFIPLTMLCRDHCHYCTFAKPPAKLDSPFLTPDAVLAIAEAGARWVARRLCSPSGTVPRSAIPVARAWLDGPWLPHDARVRPRGGRSRPRGDRAPPAPQPGRDVLRGAREAQARERFDGPDARDVVRPSLGEGWAARRIARQGPVGAPADDRDAGRLAIPFTTGILVGIGETPRERGESLFAIRDLHRRYRHVQEVIVQNFRAKAGTAMRHAPEPQEEEFLAAVATARLVLGPHVSIQAPPNLSDPEQRLRLLDAGINDWGACHHSRPTT